MKAAETRGRIAPKSDELLHIDFLRLVASVMIMVFHFGRFTVIAALQEPQSLSLAVDLFFVLSGFVITYVYRDKLATWRAYRTFLSRRIARLGPLHWLTLLFFVALGLMIVRGYLKSDHPEIFDFRCLIPNALAIHAFDVCNTLSFNFVSWSISAEMGMYLLSPAILYVGMRRPGVLALIALLALGVLFAVSGGFPATSARPFYAWTYDFGVLRAFPAFCLGAASYGLRDALAKLPRPRWWLLACGAAFFAGCGLGLNRSVLLLIVYATAIAAIACDLQATGRDWLARPAALGQLTYSIYMIHPVVLSVVITFIGRRLLHLGGWPLTGWVVVAMAVTFVASYLSYVYFETPARRWLSGARRA